MSASKELGQKLGYFGVMVWLSFIIAAPGFLAPDFLIFLLISVSMIFSKGLEALRRFGPFVLLLLIYGFFAGMADYLNSHVNFMLAPTVDRFIFHGLPTVYLQNWLWDGHVSFYDYFLTLPYMLHFVIPLVLGTLVWIFKENEYWQTMNSYLIAAYMAFATYLIFPSAPPWLASDMGYIEPMHRVSGFVLGSLGLSGVPTLYGYISINPVAAIPSLHAAWATLLFFTVRKCFGRRWSLLAAVYPTLIFIGTVYTGEHYVFDILAGVLYALVAYKASPVITRSGAILYRRIKKDIRNYYRKLSNSLWEMVKQYRSRN